MKKFTLLGAAAIPFISLATPVMAQRVISEPGYCAQFFPTRIVRMRDQTIHATISAESCRATHMLLTVSARRALHSTGAVMAASILATNRLQFMLQDNPRE